MSYNSAFRGVSDDRNLAFAAEQGFGILTVAAGDDAPLISHLPFLISPDGAFADMHLARPNPIVQALDGDLPARIVVSGPHGYVSPDWYGIDDQVPTWNYVAVHLSGTLERRPQEEMADLLEQQSAHFERLLLPKPPWRTEKMTDGLMERMMRAIVPCRLRIDQIDGTWKLGQNKPEAARLGAADGLRNADLASDAAGLAALMRQPPPRDVG